MKKFILFFTLIIAAGCTRAQTYTPKPVIPAFKVLTTDSTYFTTASVKKGKPLMVIYFSPDCSHCQHMMYELKPKMKELKNVQVLMVTFTQLKSIQTFYRDFDLKKYPNFIVATEGYTYNLQQFYHVVTTPYVALYDKNGKPAKYFDKAPKVDDVLAAVKNL